MLVNSNSNHITVLFSLFSVLSSEESSHEVLRLREENEALTKKLQIVLEKNRKRQQHSIEKESRHQEVIEKLAKRIHSLETKSSKQTNALSQAKKIIEILRKENESIKQKISDSSANSQLEKSETGNSQLVRDLQSQIELLKQEKKDLEQELFDTANGNPLLQEVMAERKELRHENEELQQKLHVLEMQLKADDLPLLAPQDKRSFREEEEEAQEEWPVFEEIPADSFKSTKTEEDILREQVQSLQKDKEDLEKQCNSYLSRIQQMEQQNFTQFLSQPSEEDDSLRQQIEELQDQCDYFSAQTNSLREELEKTKSDFEKCRIAKGLLERELAEIESSNAVNSQSSNHKASDVEFDSLKTLNSKLVNRVKEQTAQLEELNGRYNKLEESYKALQDDEAHLRDELHESSVVIAGHSKETSALEAQIGQLKQEIEIDGKTETELREQIHQMKLEIDDHAFEVDQLKLQISNLEQQRKDRDSEIEKMKTDEQNLQKQLDEKAAEIVRSKEAAQSLQAQMADLQRDIAAIKGDRDISNQKSNAMKQQFSVMMADLQNKEDANRALGEKIAALQDELESANAQYQASEEMYNTLSQKQLKFDQIKTTLDAQILKLKKEKEDQAKKAAEEKREVEMIVDRIEKENAELRDRITKFNAEALNGGAHQAAINDMIASVKGQKSEEDVSLKHRYEIMEMNMKGMEVELRQAQNKVKELNDEKEAIEKELAEVKTQKMVLEFKMDGPAHPKPPQ